MSDPRSDPADFHRHATARLDAIADGPAPDLATLFDEWCVADASGPTPGTSEYAASVAAIREAYEEYKAGGPTYDADEVLAEVRQRLNTVAGPTP